MLLMKMNLHILIICSCDTNADSEALPQPQPAFTAYSGGNDLHLIPVTLRPSAFRDVYLSFTDKSTSVL